MNYRIEVTARPDAVLEGDGAVIDRFIAAAQTALAGGFSVLSKSLTHVAAEVGTDADAETLRTGLAALPAADGLRIAVQPLDAVQAGVLARIDALVGSPAYKQLMHELYSVAPLVKRHATYDVFTNRCYLFSIGAGRGLTTALELFAELLCEPGCFASVRANASARGGCPTGKRTMTRSASW